MLVFFECTVAMTRQRNAEQMHKMEPVPQVQPLYPQSTLYAVPAPHSPVYHVMQFHSQATTSQSAVEGRPRSLPYHKEGPRSHQATAGAGDELNPKGARLSATASVRSPPLAPVSTAASSEREEGATKEMACRWIRQV